MKPIWKILIGLMVVIIAVTAWLSIVHYRAKAAVSAYRAQLLAKGEKLTIAELTPVLSPDEVKGGQDLLAAMSTVGKFTNTPPMMRWLAPGRALVGWAEAISPTDNVTNCWPELAEVLNKHPEVGEQLAAALQRPGIGFSVQYQLGPGAATFHAEVVKDAVFWLAQCMMLALHEGDTNRAWSCLLLQAALIAKYRGEPVLWSQWARNRMLELAIVTTWEALQYTGWDEKQLAQLQAGWESLDTLDIMGQSASVLSMEGATMSMLIDESRDATNFMSGARGLDSDRLLLHPKDEISNYLEPRVGYRMWLWRESYHIDLYQMHATQAALEMLRTTRFNDAFVPVLCVFNEKIVQMSTNYSRREKQYIKDWGTGEGFSSYLSQCAEVETRRRVVITVLALKRYRLRHGEYPARLEELTPGYLTKVPIDFMDGKPLRYRRKDDGTFLLYSVGVDGKDDGGDASPVPAASATFRRWEQMHDIVWPAPATAEDVKKYETEKLQKYLQQQAAKQRFTPKPVPAAAGTNSNAK